MIETVVRSSVASQPGWVNCSQTENGVPIKFQNHRFDDYCDICEPTLKAVLDGLPKITKENLLGIIASLRSYYVPAAYKSACSCCCSDETCQSTMIELFDRLEKLARP